MKKCKNAKESLAAVITVKHLGEFYGAKVVLLLQDFQLLSHGHDNIPLLGPGSHIFGQWLFFGFKSAHVEAIESSIVSFWKQLIKKEEYHHWQIEDVENAFCEAHKYCQAIGIDGYQYAVRIVKGGT